MIRLVTYVCAFGFLSFVCFAQDHAARQLKPDRELYKIIDHSPYAEWLEQDVPYIIKPDERAAFLRLQNNEQRENFIAQFWQDHNPDPTSLGNAFKEEHYRRIMYANERYSAGIPGWKTDRGRIYIVYGPPKQIESTTVNRADCDFFGGGSDAFPAEIWHYSGLQNTNGPTHDLFTFRFGDPANSGQYFLCFDPKIDVATFSATMKEQPHPMGIESYADAFPTPPADIKALEEIADSHIRRNDVKFDYRFDFIRATSDTTLVPITIQIPRTEMDFEQKDGVAMARLYALGRVTALTGRVAAEFAQPIEIDVPANQVSRVTRVPQVYQKPVLLGPGIYAIDFVVQDRNSGKIGTAINSSLAVRAFAEDTLDASSLIVAGQMYPVGTMSGLAEFVVGDEKLIPSLNQAFDRSQRMGFFLQIYNLRADESAKSNVFVAYRITRIGSGSSKAAPKGQNGTDPSMEGELSANDIIGNGVEATVAKHIGLTSLSPGKYKLEVIVSDKLGRETIMPSADFTVAPASTH